MTRLNFTTSKMRENVVGLKWSRMKSKQNFILAFQGHKQILSNTVKFW